MISSVSLWHPLSHRATAQSNSTVVSAKEALDCIAMEVMGIFLIKSHHCRRILNSSLSYSSSKASDTFHKTAPDSIGVAKGVLNGELREENVSR